MISFTRVASFCTLLAVARATAADQPSTPPTSPPSHSSSNPAIHQSTVTAAPTRAEVRTAIERGLTFLLKAQNSNGWWSTPDQPAVTSLALTTLNLEPTHRYQRSRTSEMNRG